MNLRHHTLTLVLALLAALLLLPGTIRAQSLPGHGVLPRNLLPAAAAPGEELRFAEPSVITPPAQSLRPPLLLVGKQIPAEPQGEVAKAIREAERRFQSGKFSLQEGRKEEARREFDAAIEVLLALAEETPDRAAAERKAEELIRLIHRYDVESLDSGASEGPVFVQSPLPAMLDMTFPIDPNMKGKVVAQLAATSSQLPLVVNDAVLSYMNFFTSERGRRVLYAGLKRSGRYRGMISRILDEEGVPQELIHLAQAESAFAPRAVSRAAATGMWQFVRSRGSEYGLKADRMSDERLDPEKATRAAARHLRDLYQQLGDWHLAMAAYNCGPYCVERAVQRTGYADYWELRSRNALPLETRNYVPAILAMAIVSKNLQTYGLQPVEPDPPIEYDTVQMTADTSLALIADAADLPAGDIRDLNPSLLRSLAPAGYEVRVPRSKGAVVLAALEAVPAAKRSAWRLHRVTEGETLASIARRYSTAPSSIAAVNARPESVQLGALDGGEVLLIPSLARPEPAARKALSRTGKQSVRSGGARRGSARIASVSSRNSARKGAKR
jgi:membrane-bound lytic murein transglycosylase D